MAESKGMTNDLRELRERTAETHRAIAMDKAAEAERKAAQVGRLLKLRAYDDALRVIGEAEDWLGSARLNVLRVKSALTATDATDVVPNLDDSASSGPTKGNSHDS